MNQCKKNLPLILSLALIIFTAGCAVESEFDRKIIPQTIAVLREVPWQLDAYKYQGDWVSNFETERISVIFKRGIHLNGFSGCNVFSAEYKITNNLLSMSSVRTTRKYCPFRGDIVMHTEANFLTNLKKVAAYAADHKTLILFNELGKRILVFKRKEK